MNNRHLLLAAAISASLLVLSGCGQKDAPTAPATASQAPADSADDFIARVNAEYKAMYPEMTSAQWLASTYINADSERIAAKSNERWMTVLNGWIEQAGRYDGQPGIWYVAGHYLSVDERCRVVFVSDHDKGWAGNGRQMGNGITPFRHGHQIDQNSADRSVFNCPANLLDQFGFTL